MRDLAEIKAHAHDIYRDLERLRSEVEHSSNGPDVKSSMACEISESQARVQRVLEACTVPEPITVLAAV